MDKNKVLLNGNDVFLSKCNNCSKCCLKNDLIPVSPIDLIDIKRKIGISIVDILNKYCSYGMHTETSFPLIILKRKESCLFSKEGECTLQDARPDYCRIYPLQRTTNDHDNPNVFYKMNEQCSENNLKSINTVNNFIGNPTDDYNECIKEWYQFLNRLTTDMRSNYTELLKKLDSETEEIIDHIILHILYRSLEEVDSYDYSVIKYELRERYKKTELFLMDLKSKIELVGENEQIHAENNNVIYLFKKQTQNRLKLSTESINIFKRKYVHSHLNKSSDKSKTSKKINHDTSKPKNILNKISGIFK